MTLQYRARGTVKEPHFSPDPDKLYWMLDGLDPADRGYVVFEAVTEPERFIQVLVVGDHVFDVECRESSQTALSALPAVDILVAHQAVLRCLYRPDGWESTLRQAAAEFGSVAPGSVDYERTGLSVNVAMLDHTGRKRRAGETVETPPRLRWDGLVVATGDIWRDVPAGCLVEIEVDRQRPELRHGISISSANAALSLDAREAQPEVIIWPTAEDRRFEIRCGSPAGGLRVTNVYEVGGETWSRIERWTKNAGLWVDRVSADERIYHCNHSATSPATFDDLVFSMRLR
jgi:hypothetical protein